MTQQQDDVDTLEVSARDVVRMALSALWRDPLLAISKVCVMSTLALCMIGLSCADGTLRAVRASPDKKTPRQRADTRHRAGKEHTDWGLFQGVDDDQTSIVVPGVHRRVLKRPHHVKHHESADS